MTVDRRTISAVGKLNQIHNMELLIVIGAFSLAVVVAAIIFHHLGSA